MMRRKSKKKILKSMKMLPALKLLIPRKFLKTFEFAKFATYLCVIGELFRAIKKHVKRKMLEKLRIKIWKIQIQKRQPLKNLVDTVEEMYEEPNVVLLLLNNQILKIVKIFIRKIIKLPEDRLVFLKEIPWPNLWKL